jgi:hypothetical protein
MNVLTMNVRDVLVEGLRRARTGLQGQSLKRRNGMGASHFESEVSRCEVDRPVPRASKHLKCYR